MAVRRKTPKKPRRCKPIDRSLKNFKGRLLSSQVQAVAYKVHAYFRREKLNKGPLKPFSQVTARVVEATGLSKNIFTRIKRVGDKNSPFRTPGKNRKMRRRKRDVDSFTKCAIRNLIYEFHQKRQHLTIKVLLSKIRERGIDFHGGKDTLRKVLYRVVPLMAQSR